MVAESLLLFEKPHKSLTPIQQRIRKKIRSFDAPSLLKLLYSLGYQAKDFYFMSNPSFCSPSSLFEDITFSDKDYPRVTILVNMGLLAANSPLPTYFRKKMDSGMVDPVLLTRFLSFFDHHLMMMVFVTGSPEKDNRFFLHWNETLAQYLSLLALNSTSTLWHLLQLSFPELKVEVHKFPRVLKVLSSSTILGATCIGRNSLLGKSQKLTISSFKIILTAENMDIPMNTPWPIEVKRRLKDLIFPKIHRMNIYTQIILVVKNCQDVAHLATTSRLGFRSLGKSQELIRLLLFAGYPHEGTG